MALHPVPEEKLPASDSGVRVPCGEVDVALFRVGDEFYAIENVCPHAGASLHDGWVQNGVVGCPWHGWGFDVQTGECVTVAGFDVQAFKVVVENGQVAVEVLA